MLMMIIIIEIIKMPEEILKMISKALLRAAGNLCTL